VNLIDRVRALLPRTKLFIAIASAWVIADHVAKFLAVTYLTKAFEPLVGEPPGFFSRLWIWLTHAHPARAPGVEVFEYFWRFRYVENPGAAWGFLGGAVAWFRTPFFLMVAAAAMVFIVVYHRRTLPEQGMLRVALACVFGGALGNFLDRLRFGYVIDFVDWHWYDRFTWPTWNIADAGITVGVSLLILDMLLHKPPEAAKDKGKKKPAEPEAS